MRHKFNQFHFHKIVSRISLLLGFLLCSWPSLHAQGDIITYKERVAADNDTTERKRVATSDNPSPAKYGAWETVIPERNGAAIHKSLGMASIHAILLPSGKVLLAGGSCWRNPDNSQYYPQRENPAFATGLFVRDSSDNPFRLGKKDTYFQLVNNVAVYDPAENTFFRVPSPPLIPNPNKKDEFIPNDLFCTGHLHLPNGNPLFAGGTQYYAPITGVRTSYIFDWKEELKINWESVDWRIGPEFNETMPGKSTLPWVFSGLMNQGRWYPTLVPLQDGRLTIISGLKGFDGKDSEKPYLFEVNHDIEFFDHEAFDPKNPQAAWKSIDVKSHKNSPFQKELKRSVSLEVCTDKDDFAARGYIQNADAENSSFTLPCCLSGEGESRFKRDSTHDSFKLYPHVYNMGEDRLYFTREGDWISMRGPEMKNMRNSKFTYWMNIEGNKENPKIVFKEGVPRDEYVPSFGTSFVDPNTGAIRLVGGGKNSPGTFFPITNDWTKRTRFAGARGSRDMETFLWDEKNPKNSQWEREKDFLGTHPQDDRILHNAIILPTQQVLIINGGNYQLFKPTYFPLLLTPEYDANGNFTDYKKERMNEAVEPRMYHAVAMLLPDGRVWVSGGNTSPAMVRTEDIDEMDPQHVGQPKHNPDLVDLNNYFFMEGSYAKSAKGSITLPAENWTAEIYSPPYLFIDGNRRAAITGISGSAQVEFDVEGKKVYLLKSLQDYKTTIQNLPKDNETENPIGKFALIKLPSVTHAADFGQRFYELESLKSGSGFKTPDAAEANIPPGYYMLFYIDAHGKPSEAKMVLFDDKATKP